KATGLSLLITYTIGIQERKNLPRTLLTKLTGITTGICLAALLNITTKYIPTLCPLWPDYTPLGTLLPLLSSTIGSIFNYSSLTIYVSLISTMINKATRYWHTDKFFFYLFFVINGLLFTQLPLLSALPLWFIFG